MARELTRSEFLQLAKQSGIFDADRLKRFLTESVTEEMQPREIAKAMVAADLATSWQKDRLLEGKWKGYFLGRFKLLRPLGIGGMGCVYLAEHRVMKHRVALKILSRTLLQRADLITRFEREARAAAAVNHPNIVRAHDIDREGDNYYLVMDYAQGTDLQRLVSLEGPRDARTAADYIRQVAKGLDFAHKHSIVHRDIKPANLLLDEEGVVKILDLGLARLADEETQLNPSLTVQTDAKMIGTADYLAPEQALNAHKIDGRADIYALGGTLYFLLTGVPPFPSGTFMERIIKHQTRRPVDIRKRKPGTPDELVEICSRMMAKNPADRPQTGAEVVIMMTDFLNGKYKSAAAATSAAGLPVAVDNLTALDEDQDTSVGKSGVKSDVSAAGKSSTAKIGIPPGASPASLFGNLPDSKSGLEFAGQLVPSTSASLHKSPENDLQELASLGGTPELSIFDDPLASSPNASGIGSKSRGGSSPGLSSPGNVSQGGSGVLDDPLSLTETVANSADDTGVHAAARGDSWKTSTTVVPPAPREQPLWEKIRHWLWPAHPPESGEINYPLWFLVGSGIILGLILIGVGYSYLTSFNPDKGPVKQSLEKQ